MTEENHYQLVRQIEAAARDLPLPEGVAIYAHINHKRISVIFTDARAPLREFFAFSRWQALGSQHLWTRFKHALENRHIDFDTGTLQDFFKVFPTVVDFEREQNIGRGCAVVVKELIHAKGFPWK